MSGSHWAASHQLWKAILVIPLIKTQWGKTGSLQHCWWDCKMVQPLWKSVWHPLKRLNIQLPYTLAICTLGRSSQRSKRLCTLKKICTYIFVSSLFVTVQNWRQPRCPSIDNWSNKLWYSHTMECYSARKRNGYWYTQQLAWMSRELCWVKKGQLKRIHTIRFHLHDSFEMTK